MRLNNLMNILCASCLSIPVLNLTCCNNQIRTLEDAEKYIYDRTFSIIEIGSDECCLGTAWIIDDATPSIKNDYQYYLATNYHVICGFHDVMAQTRNTCYAKSQTTVNLNDYVQFQSFEEEDESKFTFPVTGQYEIEPAIDFYVAKANFGSSQTLSSQIKENLDQLNEYRQEHGHITSFTENWTTETTFQENKSYTGGFPAKNGFSIGAEWEYHEIESDKLITSDKEEDWHEIDGDEDTPATLGDFSPQYIFDENADNPNWMSGGASGSMLLTQIDNEWKVMGIYWGGWGFNIPLPPMSIYFPAFSVFKSTYKDYITEYIK